MPWLHAVVALRAGPGASEWLKMTLRSLRRFSLLIDCTAPVRARSSLFRSVQLASTAESTPRSLAE
eukprot:5612575-Pleurochrysis_carterae.AAC.1